MAVTAAQANPTPQPDPKRKGQEPTTLDEDVSKPQVTQPGDAPFDTLLPEENATSVTPDKGAAAREGFGVVNAVTVLPVRKRRVEKREGGDRTETYEVEGPNGEPVKVTRNIETGESKAGT